MSLTPTGCITSDFISPGGYTDADACAIEVDQVIDTTKVVVKVYPLYGGAVFVTMDEGRTYNFIDFEVPFSITPTAIYYGPRLRAASFKICNLTDYIAPTLHVVSVLPKLDPTGDLPQYDRFGVAFKVALKGTGKGHLKLNWGSDHDETVLNVVEGVNTYEYNLPPGTHNICAVLFDIKI